MVMVSIKLEANSKLKGAPKPVRDRYVQNWRNVFAMKAPQFISEHIAATHPFQSRTGWAATKWKGEVVGDKVRITSLVAYTYWLNNGVRPHQMTYLLNAKGAIPIGTSGGTIFRRPSVASMLKGGWRHPGRPATHFFEQSIEKLAKFMEKSHPELIIQNMHYGT
jgi:hypothetical protein